MLIVLVALLIAWWSYFLAAPHAPQLSVCKKVKTVSVSEMISEALSGDSSCSHRREWSLFSCKREITLSLNCCECSFLTVDIHISCTEYVELSFLPEVLRKAATSSSVTKLLSVEAIELYEAWCLGFLAIESEVISVQYWIAIFTSVISKLSQEAFFGKSLVKSILEDLINLTSNYRTSFCISMLLLIN